MQIATKIVVKGTAYYNAAAAFINGSLVEGASIQLIHEPNNPYDSNAVAVHLKQTGDMLGHISRKYAPKYVQLLNANSIIHAYVHRATPISDLIHVEIRLAYTKIAEKTLQKNTRYWQSYVLLLSESGVYCITNIGTGRQYIGSSINVRERILAHLIDLVDGCHSNRLLQSDFNQFGADYFEVELLHRNLLPNNLSIFEREEISKRLDSGADLYNMTLDGQGTASNVKPAIPLSISDRSSINYDNYELKKLARTFNIGSLSFSLDELEDMKLSPEYSAGDRTSIIWKASRPWCLYVSGGQKRLMYVFRSSIEQVIRNKLIKTAEMKGHKF